MATPTFVADRYRLERRLGAGGMSTVFLALDTVLERRVAVKLLAEHLAEDEAFVARFRREALSAAKLQHPNVVQVFDSGKDVDSERHYIVMEYVEGPSCADLLRDQSQIAVDEAVRYVVDACHGLDYAHRAGVIHRDVKPGNLLVSTEADSVKLADFGIAKAAEQTRITQVGSVLGTAAYLSPEQARGEEAGPASDIYSLGVCTYQFLAGRLPHEYSSLTELALKQQNNEVDPIRAARPEVPEALDRAIRLALHVEPDHRYTSAVEMAKAVEAGARGEDTEATQRLAAYDDAATRAMPRTEYARRDPTMVAPVPARQRDPVPATTRPKKRNRAGRFLVALLLLVAGGAAAFAAVSALDGGIEAPNESDVSNQVRELKELIREYAE
ncbi:MAG TPA: protein kinase [Thermoleophilaceae bacterium]|nr:protein kinase [Thermoleophilaceae bacterium]